MKKIAKILSLSLILVLVVSFSSFASKTTLFATVTKGTPVIDGKGTDAVWKKAVTLQVKDLTSNSTKQDANHATAVAKVLWDAKYIYVYIEVKDKTMIKNSLVDYQSDSVEYFIDAKNEKATAYKGVVNGQYRLNIDGKITGFGDYDRSGFKKVSKCIKTATGYTQEVGIPLAHHGITAPKAGMKIGFDIQLNDNTTGKQRDYIVTWCQDGLGWSDPSQLGTITLK